MNYINNLNHNVYVRVDFKTTLVYPGHKLKSKSVLIDSGLDLVQEVVAKPKEKITKSVKKDESKSNTAKN
tara:strand:+ start:1787 stop:1996 length:210 start_codon:yes stop_codon:yes gene_type:complete